eukprot:340065-Chlamydomonas_euryale.AAC.1
MDEAQPRLFLGPPKKKRVWPCTKIGLYGTRGKCRHALGGEEVSSRLHRPQGRVGKGVGRDIAPHWIVWRSADTTTHGDCAWQLRMATAHGSRTWQPHMATPHGNSACRLCRAAAN